MQYSFLDMNLPFTSGSCEEIIADFGGNLKLALKPFCDPQKQSRCKAEKDFFFLVIYDAYSCFRVGDRQRLMQDI